MPRVECMLCGVELTQRWGDMHFYTQHGAEYIDGLQSDFASLRSEPNSFSKEVKVFHHEKVAELNTVEGPLHYIYARVANGSKAVHYYGRSVDPEGTRASQHNRNPEVMDFGPSRVVTLLGGYHLPLAQLIESLILRSFGNLFPRLIIIEITYFIYFKLVEH